MITFSFHKLLKHPLIVPPRFHLQVLTTKVKSFHVIIHFEDGPWSNHRSDSNYQALKSFQSKENALALFMSRKPGLGKLKTLLNTLPVETEHVEQCFTTIDVMMFNKSFVKYKSSNLRV